jgi:hypothetical protein
MKELNALKEMGINVQLFTEGGKEIVPEKDGFISGSLADAVAIRVAIPRDSKFYAFNVDGSKNVTLSEDRTKGNGPSRVSQDVVRVEWSGRYRVFCTKFPHNNIRILQLEDDGYINLWRVSVISQKGNFFLTAEISHSANCYHDKEKAVCPDLKWPSLNAALTKLMPADMIGRLPDINEDGGEYVPPPEVAKESVGKAYAPGTARVVWWSMAEGRGRLATPEGNVSIHWTQASRQGSRLVYYQVGELVSYAGLRKPEHVMPRPTTWKLEAYGVKLL